MLRGAAVLAVLLFHLQVPGFASGFLGVDIFFVISGYLMAKLYRPGQAREFFNRRARRLLPAYLLTVLVVLLVAAPLVAPHEYQSVVEQSLWSVAYAPNVGFWAENSYFSKSTFKPLLHLWSLGVEIQFYLLVPLFALLLARSRPGLLMVLVCSMLGCFVITAISPKTAFFWLPARLWEFLLGFSVAGLSLKPMQPALLNLLRIAALLILAAAILSQINGQSPGFVSGHPGLTALVVSLASAAVILLGIPDQLTTGPGATVLEKLGDYSYEVYLVHFPVIALVLYRPFAGTLLEPDGAAAWMAIVILTGVLSVLMQHTFVEPLRKAPLRSVHACAAMVLIALSIVPLQMANTQTVSKREQLIYAAWDDRAGYRCGKLFRVLQPRSTLCEITSITNPQGKTLLVGNSHADAIKTGLARVAQNHNIALYLTVENNPLMPGGTPPDVLLRRMSAIGIDTAVVHYSPRTGNLQIMEEFLAVAHTMGISVALIQPVPVWPVHIPEALINNTRWHSDLPNQTHAEYVAYNTGLRSWLEEHHSRLAGIYDVAHHLCQPQCTYVGDDGRPLYFDNGHLTLTGADRLTPLFEEVIAGLYPYGPTSPTDRPVAD